MISVQCFWMNGRSRGHLKKWGFCASGFLAGPCVGRAQILRSATLLGHASWGIPRG